MSGLWVLPHKWPFCCVGLTLLGKVGLSVARLNQQAAAYWGPDIHMGRTAVFPSSSTMGRFFSKLGIS